MIISNIFNVTSNLFIGCDLHKPNVMIVIGPSSLSFRRNTYSATDELDGIARFILQDCLASGNMQSTANVLCTAISGVFTGLSGSLEPNDTIVFEATRRNLPYDGFAYRSWIGS